jgi:hypothetical protein
LSRRILASLDSEILWRPAPFLFLIALFAIAAGIRGRIAPVVLATPFLIHSASLLIANVAQDARYQFPVYIFAMACLPFLPAVFRRPTESYGQSNASR